MKDTKGTTHFRVGSDVLHPHLALGWGQPKGPHPPHCVQAPNAVCNLLTSLLVLPREIIFLAGLNLCWGDLGALEVAGSSSEGDAVGFGLPGTPLDFSGASTNSRRFSANNPLKSGEGNPPTQAYPADPGCLASPMQKSLSWLVALGKGKPPDPGAEQGRHRTRCCPFHLQPDSVVQTNGAERLGQGEQLLAEVIHSAAELIGDTGSLQQERGR